MLHTKKFPRANALLLAIGLVAICAHQAHVRLVASPAMEAVPLIPRTVLFGDPEKIGLTISPDGTKIAYLAPLDGVLNIWVRTIGRDDDRPLTHERGRGINNCHWTEDCTHLLFHQDQDGDENSHLYKIDLETLERSDLTPFPAVRAQLIATNKLFPNTVLFNMNREDPALFDVYRLNVRTGAIDLVAKNPGNVIGWREDASMQIRAARKSTRLLPSGRKVPG
ncbi:MAG: hypothetical protein M1549_01565 [Candidatus Dependentiae bacterium]|nr:hypothetical protein [Candidatus Dependentiae bacterium]